MKLILSICILLNVATFISINLDKKKHELEKQQYETKIESLKYDNKLNLQSLSNKCFQDLNLVKAMCSKELYKARLKCNHI